MTRADALVETPFVRFRPQGVLARNRDFRWLFSARTVSHIGDGMALVALLLYVEETQEAGIAVGLYLLSITIPTVVVGPFAGTVADRTDQRRLMIVTDLGQALVYGAIALFLGVAFAAVDNVALVFLARDVFETGALGFGGLASAFGIGMLVASASLISTRIKLAASTLFLVGMLLSGAGTLLTGLAPALGVALAVQAIAGAGNGVGNVASDTLVQQTIARNMLGRVFALVRVGAVAGSSLAALVGGFLLDLTSPRAVFVIGGAGVLGVVALAWAHLPRGPRDLTARAD